MINKPYAGQDVWKSCHIYENGTVRCVGSNSDEREEIVDWTKAEKAIIHKACALICAKVGEYEGSDQAKIITALDDRMVELKEARVVKSVEPTL